MPATSTPNARRLPLILLGLLCLSLASGAARADLVHLKNGRVLQGEVVKEDKEYLVLRVPYGEVKLRKDQIEYVERQSAQEYGLDVGQSLLQRQRYVEAVAAFEQAVQAKPDNRVAQAALANAVRSHAVHLHKYRRLDEARKAYQRLLQLLPGDAAAEAALNTLAAELARLDELVKAGHKALLQEDWDGAIEALRQAQAYSPDAAETVGPLLGAAHGARARGLYLKNDYAGATRELEQAFVHDATLANKLENLYAASALSVVLAQFSSGEIPAARAGLDRILAFAPANPHALYISGRLEQVTRDFKAAAQSFAKALRVKTTASSAEGAALLRADLEKKLGIPDGGASIRFDIDAHDLAGYTQAAAGDFKTLESAHFSIHHHNEVLAEATAEVLEHHRNRITELTGLTADWTQKPKVFLHRSKEEYMAATQKPEWTGGIARFAHQHDGAIVRMQIHSWQASPRLLKSVLPHELMHLIVNSNLKSFDLLPVAIHEGFSVTMEPEYRHRYYLGFLRTRLQSQSYIPLEELLQLKDYPGDPDFFYAEGYALVRYVTERFGWEKALRLITNAHREGGVEAELLELTGSASISDLEKKFQAWLKESL